MKTHPTQFDVRENTASPRQHDSRLATDVHSDLIRTANATSTREFLHLMINLRPYPLTASYMPRHNARPQERETEASFSRSVKLPRCCEFQCPGSMDECANGLRSGCQDIGLANTGDSANRKYWSGSGVTVTARMRLDVRVTLGSDIGKGRRATLKIERRKMARCHYQNGCLFVRGKRRKVWVARWREDVILADRID